MRYAASINNKDSAIIDPAKVGLTLLWFGGIVDSRGESWYEKYNTIPIGCDSEGTIRLDIRKQVKGAFMTDLVTEINLPFSKWTGNPALQEYELGMAYSNPRYILVHQSTEPGSPRGLGQLP
jgi:hypothetical protein